MREPEDEGDYKGRKAVSRERAKAYLMEDQKERRETVLLSSERKLNEVGTSKREGEEN